MKGFTLIEILVTMVIMAILSTIVALNVNNDKPKVVVEKASQELYSNLLLARNLAFSGAVFQDQLEDDQLEVPYGYGIHLDQQAGEYQYFIFGDLYSPFDSTTGNMHYDSTGVASASGVMLSEQGNWPVQVLDQKITLAVQNIDNPANPVDLSLPLDIFFQNPNGETHYYQDSTQDSFNALRLNFGYEDQTVSWDLVIDADSKQIYLEQIE